MKTTIKEIEEIILKGKASVEKDGVCFKIMGFVSNIRLKKLIVLVERNGDGVFLSKYGYLVVY